MAFDIDKGIAPLLIDCLNCEKVCNGGPGTLNREKSYDEIEHLVEKKGWRFSFHTGSTGKKENRKRE